MIRPDTRRPRLRPGVRLSRLEVNVPQPGYLARLPDGRSFRISAYLHEVLSRIDGTRTVAELAAALSTVEGRRVPPKEIAWVLESKLRPEGFLAPLEDWEDEATAGPPEPSEVLAGGGLLSLGRRGARTLSRIAQPLLSPLAVALLAPAVVVAQIALLLELARSAGAPVAVQSRGLVYLGALPIVLLGIGFHELGHLAACRRFGCDHGGFGIGFARGLPVGVADTRDVWALSRLQRVVVDLGGVWFQTLFIVLLTGLYLLTRQGWLLLAACLLVVGVAWVMTPLPRSDGYWLLSDLLGATSLERWSRDPHRGGSASLAAGNLLPVLSLVAVWLGAGLLTVWMGLGLSRLYPAMAAASWGRATESLASLQLAVAAESVVGIVAPAALLLGLVLCTVRLVRGAHRYLGAVLQGGLSTAR